MLDKNYILEIIEKVTENTGFFLVDLTLSRTNLVQVYLDHPEGISLDDCARFSHQINELLDRDKEDYELQVSSPGLGQPLKVFQQYQKSVGEKLDITLVTGERMRGELIEAKPGESPSDSLLILKPAGTKRKPAAGGSVEIPLETINIARVVFESGKGNK